MFADSLLESSWKQRSRQGWTTLSSFGIQAVMLGLLLLIPLLRPIALPYLQPLTAPIALTVPRGLPPQVVQHVATALQSNLMNNMIIAPRSIPTHILNVDESAAPPQIATGGEFVPGATGGGDLRGILGSVGTSEHPVMAAAVVPPIANHVRVSRMMEGNLIRRVQPVYPSTAKMARIQGQVVLSAVIGKEGSIEKIQVLAGHPLLVQSAVEAVKHWKYRPYILNDQPVEVETQITVNFSLSGS